MTFGYSAYLTDLGDPAGAYISLADTIWRYTGDYAASNLTSTLSGTDVVTCTTTYTISGTATGESDRTLTFAYSVLRANGAEGQPGVINVSGTAYQVRPTLS